MNISFAFTAAHRTNELKSVLSESLGEGRRKEGIGERAAVDEEDQQNLGVSNCDEGNLEPLPEMAKKEMGVMQRKSVTMSIAMRFPILVSTLGPWNSGFLTDR